MQILEQKKVADFVVSPFEKLGNAPVRTMNAAPYDIAVVNLSSQCLDIAGTRYPGAKDWNWFGINRICRNCTTSYKQCASENKFDIIFSVDCNSRPFELFVGYRDGNTARGAVWNITPNCSSAGGVIGVD